MLMLSDGVITLLAIPFMKVPLVIFWNLMPQKEEWQYHVFTIAQVVQMLFMYSSIEVLFFRVLLYLHGCLVLITCQNCRVVLNDSSVKGTVALRRVPVPFAVSWGSSLILASPLLGVCSELWPLPPSATAAQHLLLQNWAAGSNNSLPNQIFQQGI